MLSLEKQDNIARKLGHAMDMCYNIRMIIERENKGCDPHPADNFAWDLLALLGDQHDSMVNFLETYGKDVD